jgi:hypothetical protein
VAGGLSLRVSVLHGNDKTFDGLIKSPISVLGVIRQYAFIAQDLQALISDLL